jgi:hypothetical protein
MAKTLNSALSSIYDRFVFTGSTRSEFYYTGGIGGDDAQVTALQLTTLKNVDDEVVLITDGSQDVTLSNDLKLLSDASVLNFGAHNDVKLTHVADTGLLLTQDGSGSIPVLQIREAGLAISSSTSGQLDIDAGTELELGAPTIDINASTACEIDNTNTTNGVKVGVNTTGGKVFIGHTSSETTVNDNLTVTGTITANSTVALNDDVTLPHGKKIIFDSADTYIYANTDDPEDLYMKADADILLIPDGNVGIGTPGPVYKLEVNSGATNEVARFISSDDTAQIIVADDGDGVYFGLSDDSNVCYMGFQSGAHANNLNITGDGDVGIGTITPSYLFELHHPTQSDGNTDDFWMRETITTSASGTAKNGLGIKFGTMEATAERGGAILVKPTATYGQALEMHFRLGNAMNSSGDTQMLIKHDGKVGIGMTPNTAFNVKGAADSGIRLYKSDGTTLLGKFEGDGSEDLEMKLYQSDGTLDIQLWAQNDAVSFIKTGNFGIGDTSPDYQLSVGTSSKWGVQTDFGGATTTKYLTIVDANDPIIVCTWDSADNSRNGIFFEMMGSDNSGGGDIKYVRCLYALEGDDYDPQNGDNLNTFGTGGADAGEGLPDDQIGGGLLFVEGYGSNLIDYDQITDTDFDITAVIARGSGGLGADECTATFDFSDWGRMTGRIIWVHHGDDSATITVTNDP